MTPTSPTGPRPGRLPPSLTPAPVTLPIPDRPRGPAAPDPPTAAQPTNRHPDDIITDLATQLTTLGIPATTMYTAASHNRALLSLPQTTIWATSHTLTWTHRGQPVTWPAHDITGAAARLAQLTHRPSPAGTPVPPGTPGPGPAPGRSDPARRARADGTDPATRPSPPMTRTYYPTP